MSKQVIDYAIEEFIKELRNGKRCTDMVHHNNRMVYACAV
jgi:hypothetical protein